MDCSHAFSFSPELVLQGWQKKNVLNACQKVKTKPTTRAILRRSPIQVLATPDMA